MTEQFVFLHLTSKILENSRSEGRLNDFPAEIDACSFHVLFLSETWRDEAHEVLTSSCPW